MAGAPPAAKVKVRRQKYNLFFKKLRDRWAWCSSESVISTRTCQFGSSLLTFSLLYKSYFVSARLVSFFPSFPSYYKTLNFFFFYPRASLKHHHLKSCWKRFHIFRLLNKSLIKRQRTQWFSMYSYLYEHSITECTIILWIIIKTIFSTFAIVSPSGGWWGYWAEGLIDANCYI